MTELQDVKKYLCYPFSLLECRNCSTIQCNLAHILDINIPPPPKKKKKKKHLLEDIRFRGRVDFCVAVVFLLSTLQVVQKNSQVCIFDADSATFDG